MNRSGRDTPLWTVDAAGAGAALVLTALGYYGALQPLLRSHVQRDAARVELDDLRAQISDAAPKLALARTELEGLRRAAPDRPPDVPAGRFANQRLAAITDLAGRHGLVVDDLRTADGRAVKGFEAIPIQLGGRGSFRSCAQFLHHLHRTFVDMGVTGFQLADNRGGGADQISYQFDLTWYAAPSVSAAAE
jgi:hypothetical protein